MSDLLYRIRSLFRRGTVEEEMNEELRFHLEREAERNQGRGMPHDQAAREARMALGGFEQVKEECRDARGVTLVENFIQDLRYGLRVLRRSPGFAAVAVLSLALGIGANAAIFSMADVLLLRPLPVPNPDQVVVLSTDRPDSPEGLGGVSYPDYREFRNHAKSFEGIIAYQFSAFSVAKSVNDTPQLRTGVLVSDNFFQTAQVTPALGRGLLPEEGEVSGRNAVVVLAYDFWRREFYGDPAVVGRSIRINGVDFDIVGVARQGFTGLDVYVRPDFFVPTQMWQRLSGAAADPLEDRSNHAFSVDGRLRPGVTPEKAQAELETIWKGLERQHSEGDQQRLPRVRTVLQARIHDDTEDAYLITLLLGLVAVVLIIACANVANLLLGRARARSREIAIRMALGVSRSRLVRQLLTESVLLAMIGGIVGLGFAYAGIRFLQIRPPTSGDGLQILIAPRLDHRVLLFSLLAAMVSAVLCGLVPALQTSKADLVPALKNAEPGQGVRQRAIGRNALVIAQVALSMVLLAATGMLVNGFRKALLSDPGFRTDHILILQLDTSFVRYTPTQNQVFYKELLDRARTLPGVTAVSLGENTPFGTGQNGEAVIPEGFQFPKGQSSAGIVTSPVDENYFSAIRMPITQGRAFTAHDDDKAPLVAIVNQQFVKTYWPNQDPLGKRLQIGSKKDQWLQVVGVTPTAKYFYLGEPPQPYLYVPFAQNRRSRMALFTHTSVDPAGLAMPLRQLVHSLDPNEPVFNVMTLEQFIGAKNHPVQMVVEVVATMGLVGLSLALIGLYGLVAYSVARRTREIGVRMAIGARQTDVLRMVLRQGFLLSLIGIGIGGVIAAAISKAIVAGFVGLGSLNAAVCVLVPLLLMLVTLGACYVPARRAARVDPLAALRAE